MQWKKLRTQEQKKLIADSANQLLTSPAFIAAIDDIETSYLELWTSTELRDVSGREKLYLAINLLKRLKNQLVSYQSDYQFDIEKAKQNSEIARRRQQLKKTL